MDSSLSTIDFKIFVSGLFRRCKGVGTEFVYWQYMLWAFLALHSGKFPENDAFGSPLNDPRGGLALAGMLFAVIWVVKGDMDWLANALKLEIASGRLMCPWCRANCCEDSDDEFYAPWGHPKAPWNDVSPDAEWRRWIPKPNIII